MSPGNIKDLDIEKMRRSQRSIVNLVAYTTEACNLACDYCFVPKKKNPKSMDNKTGEAMVDFLIKNSGAEKRVSIAFFGGEPLLNFGLIKHVVNYGSRKAKEAGKVMNFSATTNGTLFALKPEILKYWEEHKLGVLLSIDGCEQTHNLHRKTKDGEGSWKLAIQCIPTLRRYLKVFTVRVTYFPDHFDLLEDIMALMKLGAPNIAVVPVAEADFDDPETWSKVEKMYWELAKVFVSLARNDCILPLSFERKMLLDMWRIRHGGSRKRGPCGAGKGMLGISTEGIAYPCHRFVAQDKYRLGDVFNGIDPVKRAEFLQINQDKIKGDLEDCAMCRAFEVCGGSCIANNNVWCDSMYQSVGGHCKIIRLRYDICNYIYNLLVYKERNPALINYLTTHSNMGMRMIGGQGKGQPKRPPYPQNINTPKTIDESIHLIKEGLKTAPPDIKEKLKRELNLEAK